MGRPQDAYRSLHIVGTNGKTSTAVFCTEILRRRGWRVGTAISPHSRRWSERTLIDGAEIEPEPFAAAVERVREAVGGVEASLEPGERVSQFEVAIAVSLVAFAEAGVEVAVVEAGLGGRLDATNVLESTATALPSVGLEHTEWLGETLAEIAAEKLAVLRPQSTLVVGPLPDQVMEQAAARAEACEAELRPVEAPTAPAAPPFLELAAAIALELARTIDPGAEPLGELLAHAPGGRAELLGGDPPTLVDVAHNPDGAAALAAAIAALELARPRIGCVAVLADKDAEGMVEALTGELDRLICTAIEPRGGVGRPGARALAPASLAALAERAGIEAEVIADPARAVADALEQARRSRGVAIFFGSHYLLPYVWTARSDQSCSR